MPCEGFLQFVISSFIYHSLPQQLSDARVAYRPKSRGEAIVGVGGVRGWQIFRKTWRASNKKRGEKGMTICGESLGVGG